MGIDSVSFGAKYIDFSFVKKYDKASKKFLPSRVSFVKLEAGNKDDIDALDFAEKKWAKADFMPKIATAGHWMENNPIEIYALTCQADNFEKLRGKDILAFAEIRNDDTFPNGKQLHYLQVRPNAQNVNSKQNKYKHVGKKTVLFLQKIYDEIYLFSKSDENIKSFYESCGFKEDFCGTDHFRWRADIFTRAKSYLRKLFRGKEN